MKTGDIDIIACPICKSRLIYDREHRELICRADKLAFPLNQNNIPILLVEIARQLTEEELKK